VIPPQAVEAAAKAFYGCDYGDIMAYEDAQYATSRIVKALEAAAPYMLNNEGEK
jgi:hypothetical protein